MIWYVHTLANIYAYIDGLVQDCSNSIANALELLQSCNEPSIYIYESYIHKCLAINIKTETQTSYTIVYAYYKLHDYNQLTTVSSH